MSQTNSAQCASPTPFPFNQDAWDFLASQTQQIVVLAALPTVLQGVFTILCAASLFALIQCVWTSLLVVTLAPYLTTTPGDSLRRDGKVRVPSIVLSLALLALFTSTTIYFVYTILSTLGSLLNLLVLSAEALLSLPRSQISQIPITGLFKDYRLTEACARTSALSANILLGDAIVCWRACVLWQGNRAIRAICAVFVLGTFGLGLVDIKHTCVPDTGRAVTRPRNIGAEFLYAGFSYGIAASAPSFATNFWATALVGYKVLVSRRFVRKHVIAGSLGLQTERVLSLLLESGAFYCAIWAIVVTWQIGEYAATDASTATAASFWGVYGIMIEGALVPVIAVYPTIIIILVALNRSQIERGFGRDDDPAGPGPARMPLRTLTVTVASVAEEVQADARQAEMREADLAELKHARAESGSTTVTGGPSTEVLIMRSSSQASPPSSPSAAV